MQGFAARVRRRFELQCVEQPALTLGAVPLLPDGGTDVNAIVTVTCSGAGTAGQTGAGSAGEIIIVDTSGSMGPDTMAAAKQAAQAALAEIVDGTLFAVVSGSDHADLAYPHVTSGRGMVPMDERTRQEFMSIVNRRGQRE